MTERYNAPVVKKAIQVLKAIALSREGAGISELSRKLGFHKSTLHGITAALEEMRVIERDKLTKKYTLGPILFELASVAYSQVDIKELARPVMQELMEAVQETVFLGTYSAEHVTVIDVVESRNRLTVTGPIGISHPLFAGAVGKVFLASLKEEEAMKIIEEKGLPAFTQNSITDPQLYLEEIRRVKDKGYATDNEEYMLGVQAVASLIKSATNYFVIWVTGFKILLPDYEKVHALLEETKRAAEKIEKRIAEHEETGSLR